MSSVPSKHASSRPGTGARAALATTEIVGFAAFAHLHAAGSMPDPGQLLALSAVTFAAAVTILHGAVRLRYAVPAVALLQLGLHTAFTATTAPSMMSPSMSHHEIPGTRPVPDHSMLSAHLVSIAITVLVLLAQDQAIRLLGSLRTPGVAPIPAPPATARPALARLVRRRAGLLTASPRRGPPIALPLTP